jgi:putative endonuclease
MYLFCKGYTVIERRYKTPMGEVDIVARKRSTLAFIEVKARKDANVLEVLTQKQQEIITRAALLFIANHPRFAKFNIRFDLVRVSAPWSINHLTNAWQVS